MASRKKRQKTNKQTNTNKNNNNKKTTTNKHYTNNGNISLFRECLFFNQMHCDFNLASFHTKVLSYSSYFIAGFFSSDFFSWHPIENIECMMIKLEKNSSVVEYIDRQTEKALVRLHKCAV